MLLVRGYAVRLLPVLAVFISLARNGIQVSLGASPTRLLIENNCGRIVQLEKAYLPMVSDWSALPVNGSSCDVGFHSWSSCHDSEKTHVQLSVLKLDFPGTLRPCNNQSRVDVVDSDGQSIISDPTGLCGQTSHVSFTCTTDLLYLRVTSRDRNLAGKLKVLATAYNTFICDTTKEFGCDNHRCIAKSLVCNGYNDCGDDSDEDDGCWMSTQVIVFIVVGSAVVVSALIIISALAYKKRLSWGVGPTLATSGKVSLNGDERWPLLKG